MIFKSKYRTRIDAMLIQLLDERSKLKERADNPGIATRNRITAVIKKWEIQDKIDLLRSLTKWKLNIVLVAVMYLLRKTGSRIMPVVRDVPKYFV